MVTEIHDYCLDVEHRTIWLHNPTFDSENLLDLRTAIQFNKNLSYLNALSSEPITVRMHLSGGDFEEGLTIFDGIKASKASIKFIVYGYAYSMSGIILQAAHERIMMPSARFMAHYVTTYNVNVETKKINNLAEANERCNETMLDIYAIRCRGSKAFGRKSLKSIKDEIRRQFDEKEDWYLTADEAVYYGFADSVESLE